MSSSGNAEEAEMKVITLISSDNARIDVVEAAALQSETLKHLIEDGCACEFIPVPGVILSMVLKYCNRLAGLVPDAPKLDDEEALKAFRTDFVQDLDLDTLFQLVKAANYLCIKSLQYLISQTIVDMTKDNTLVQCRSDSMTSGKVIVVSSSDGVVFEVGEAVALQCETLKHMIEDDCSAGIIPLPNVTSGIMSKVIEYCKRRVSIWEADKEHKKKKLASEFVGLDQETLLDLVMAADYLEIKGLLDLLCERVADTMRGKTPQQIRETFNIKNDFTKEEEDKVRRENAWALE